MTIQLTIKNYRCFVSPVTIDLAEGFTAFVGVNNAGKSTIMRFLLEMRSLFHLIRDINQFRNSLIQERIGNFVPLHVSDPQEIFSNLNERGIEFSFDLEPSDVNSKAATKVAFNIFRDLTWRSEISVGGSTIQTRGVGADFPNGSDLLYQNSQVVADMREFSAIVQLLSNTLYIGPFRNTVNVGGNTDYLDIQIGESFIKQFRSLKTGPTKAHSTGIENLTNDIKKIFEFETLDIVPSADDKSLHITVNRKPYKQHELGSGLMQFVVVLANASIKRPGLILIDEPELNLHPRLQLDFVTTLGSYASNGVWFSTHNVGLARSSAERVYSVVKRADGDSIIRLLEGTPRLSEFLGEMSFSSHKELGFEKLLLVEGSTEVKVVQQLLRKVGKDHRVVLLPMNGRIPQAEELEELLRITTKIAAVIDSERASADAPLEKMREEFVELCETKGIECLVLERRATENYFSDAAVKKVFGASFRGLGPYELLRGVQPHWGKSENWKVAAEMNSDEWRATDLGQFVDAL